MFATDRVDHQMNLFISLLGVQWLHFCWLSHAGSWNWCRSVTAEWRPERSSYYVKVRFSVWDWSVIKKKMLLFWAHSEEDSESSVVQDEESALTSVVCCSLEWGTTPAEAVWEAHLLLCQSNILMVKTGQAVSDMSHKPCRWFRCGVLQNIWTL